MLFFEVIKIVLVVLVVKGCECRDKVVEIPGYKPIQCDGDKVYECRHVQYAEYPFKFEKTKLLVPWKEVNFEYYLTMDIFTKNLTSEKPVIVGFLQENLGEFDFIRIPRLITRRSVFVSVQYRRGLHGFLSTDTSEIAGNAALEDILIALNWIKEYISYFGGNPNLLTLMGLGDSGALVHALTISPKIPRNLFHRAIITDTTLLTPRLITASPVQYSLKVAEESGCINIENILQLNKCLLDPANNIEKIRRRCYFKEEKRTILNPIKLVIGNYSGFLPSSVERLVEENRRKYPILFGSSFTVHKGFLSKLAEDDDFVSFTPSLDKIFEDAFRIIKHYSSPVDSDYWTTYIQSEILNMTMENFSKKVIYQALLPDLITSIDSKYPLLEAAQYNAKYSSKGTYLYTFDYEIFTLSENQLGFMEYDNFETKSRESKVLRNLIEIWLSFAENGKPPESLPNIYETWPAFLNGTTGPYLRMNRHSFISNNFEEEFLANRIKYGKIYQSIIN